MTITASELKNNLGKYLELAQSEDIYITKNGTKKIKLSNAVERPLVYLDSVFKDISISDEEIDDLKWERLKNV